MIEIHRGLFTLLSWLLIGPINVRAPNDLQITLTALTCVALGFGVAGRRSLRGRSAALTCALAIMLLQTVMLALVGLHRELLRSVELEGEGLRHFFSFFFDINLGLAVIGVFAAIGASFLLLFGNSRLHLTNMFPEITFLEAPSQLVKDVNLLSMMAGINPPQVSLIDSGDPIAFVTRSKQGLVLAVSVGLLESLTGEEVKACIAHELSHLKNRDFVIRAFATMARVGLFIHPLSHLIEPAVYRARELLADKTAVELMGNPNPLISALSKIGESQTYLPNQSGSIQVACLWGSVGTKCLTRLFSKHPTIDTRIKALSGDL